MQIKDKELERAEQKLQLLKQAEGLAGKELDAFLKKHNIKKRTFYEWKKKYQEQGFEGLIRKQRADKGQSRKVPDFVRKIIISKYCSPSRPSARQIWLEVKAICEFEGLPVPSKSTVNRIIKDIPQPVVVLSREGKKRYTDKCEPHILRERPEFPREILVGDHHQFDIFVFAPGKRNPVRPWLTAWLDPCTNEITGFYISAEHPTAQNINLAFRHSLIKKKDPAYPSCGIPNAVYLDRGKDFRSKAFRYVTNQLGVERRFALPYHAQSKPIERFFGTLERELIQKLPGWCGRNPQERPENVKPELELQDLKIAVYEWIRDIYHHTPSTALGNKSPLEVLNEKMKQGWNPRIAPESVLNYLMLRIAGRKVNRHGITLMGRDGYYWADELIPLIGKYVDILYDPDDLSEVLIYHNDEFVCRAKHELRMKYSASQRDIKRAIQRKKKARELINNYLEEMKIAQAGLSDLEVVIQERQREERHKVASAVGQSNIIQLLPELERRYRETEQYWQKKENLNPNPELILNILRGGDDDRTSQE